MKPDGVGFRPNLFVDIGENIEEKLKIFSVFESEKGEFPFPRSDQAIKALAQLRGTQSNVKAAEAFMILKEIY